MCITSVYASVYASLTIVLGSFSYGLVNLRVANIMLGMVPIVGWPAIVGQALGVSITASVSPLGPADFLNAPAALFFSWLIWRMRSLSVFLGLASYSLGLGFTVAETIQYASGTALLLVFPYVVIGIFLMTGLGGYVFYRSIRRSAILTSSFALVSQQ
jgi:hypothetical protein